MSPFVAAARAAHVGMIAHRDRRAAACTHWQPPRASLAGSRASCRNNPLQTEGHFRAIVPVIGTGAPPAVTETTMRTKQLLFAALVLSGVAAAGAAQPEHRVNAAHGPALLRVDHTPPPRAVQPSYAHRDRYSARRGLSPYKPAIDRNGWFLGWEDLNGNPLPSNRRFGPPPPPSPYHRPVVDQHGWFVHWDDYSGDVSTHPLHASGRTPPHRLDRD